MEAFELADLIASRAASGQRYLEFLRVPALSAGLSMLPAGGVDPQRHIPRTRRIASSPGAGASGWPMRTARSCRKASSTSRPMSSTAFTQ